MKNKNSSSGSGLHEGHRERMRSKFKIHGGKVFETHELLEMLLYHIIPYKDTNPVAWRILKRFSSLDGIAEATTQELATVEGVGERCAEFIHKLFSIYNELDTDGSLFAGERKIDKTSAGEFFVNYINAADKRDGELKYRIVALMLDSDMRILSVTEPYQLDFASGAVKSKPFIDAAVAAHATTIIIAHSHPFGTCRSTRSDKVSNSLICDELAIAGITLLDHYIVCGNEYCTINDDKHILKLGQRKPWIISRDGTIALSNLEENFSNAEKLGKLFAILSLVLKEESALKKSNELSERFVRLCDVFYADTYVLKSILGSDISVTFLKLFFTIYLRRKTDRFVFGRAHTVAEIAEYFSALIGYEPIEKVYVMLFDSRGRPKCCEFVEEGTVDRSNLSLRRILEIVRRCEAQGLALVHNHPSSGVAPSLDDKSATCAITEFLKTAGIDFYHHYIISSDDFCVINENYQKYKEDFIDNPSGV